MLFNYHLFVFSDFVTDPQVKSNCGISAIVLVTLDILWVTTVWARDKVIGMIWETRKRCVFIPQQKRFRAEKERNKWLKQGRIEADERVLYNKECLEQKLELE